MSTGTNARAETALRSLADEIVVDVGGGVVGTLSP
jgi:hypothetical protein